YRRRDYRWCTRRGGRRGNWVQHHQERARKGDRQRARCGKRSESRRGGRWSAWAQSGQEEGMAQASRLSGCPTQCLSGPLPSGLLSFMCSTDIAYGIITLMTTPRRRAECSRLRLLMLIVILLPACAAQSVGRDGCAKHLDAAWAALDLAKAEGFAGTVSYGKAVGLLTGAKTQQAFE